MWILNDNAAKGNASQTPKFSFLVVRSRRGLVQAGGGTDVVGFLKELLDGRRSICFASESAEKRNSSRSIARIFSRARRLIAGPSGGLIRREEPNCTRFTIAANRNRTPTSLTPTGTTERDRDAEVFGWGQRRREPNLAGAAESSRFMIAR